MPIRFRCTYCGQLLSIATRKARSTVDCPKCRQPNIVPAAEDATVRRGAGEVVRALESERFDEWLGLARTTAAERGEPATVVARATVTEEPPAAASDSESAIDENWRGDPESLPDPRDDAPDGSAGGISRSALLMSGIAVLFLVIAFGLGFLLGRLTAFPAG